MQMSSNNTNRRSRCAELPAHMAIPSDVQTISLSVRLKIVIVNINRLVDVVLHFFLTLKIQKTSFRAETLATRFITSFTLLQKGILG